MERRFETFPLTIEFGGAQYGLLCFTLALGGEKFVTRFSEAFDPILRFKHWLEAIAVGVEQCSFSFDTEGDDIRFGINQISWKWCEFTAANDYAQGDDDILLRGMVDRRQMVQAFYRGFLDHDASPEFDRYEWERRPASAGPWSGHEGTKLSTIKSTVIEKFLRSAKSGKNTDR